MSLALYLKSYEKPLEATICHNEVWMGFNPLLHDFFRSVGNNAPQQGFATPKTIFFLIWDII